MRFNIFLNCAPLKSDKTNTVHCFQLIEHCSLMALGHMQCSMSCCLLFLAAHVLCCNDLMKECHNPTLAFVQHSPAQAVKLQSRPPATSCPTICRLNTETSDEKPIIAVPCCRFCICYHVPRNPPTSALLCGTYANNQRCSSNLQVTSPASNS